MTNDDSKDCTKGSHHDEITLQLAAQESAEQLLGMDALYKRMRQRPLQIRAYRSTNDESPASDVSVSTKTVHFVRHGQGFHNLLADMAKTEGTSWRQFDSSDANNPYLRAEIRDAPLTDKGRQQARLLSKQSYGDQPQLIVVSPMCRTLQTSLLAFGKNQPVLAH